MSTTIDIDQLKLLTGSHGSDPPSCGKSPAVCFWEAYNLIRDPDGPKTDKCPEGVSPVLHRFGMRLNDVLPEGPRQLLKPYLPQPGQPSPLEGTADDGFDEIRQYMAVDWAVRVATPMWLDAAGRTEFAAELRAVPPIVDAAGRSAIRPRLYEIADACDQARRTVRQSVYDKAKAAAAKAIAEGKDPVAAADAVAVAVAVAAADADAAAVAAAVAVAVADAAAVAAAVAAADADADAAADADADAAADAAADADAARGTNRWWQIRSEVYDKVYPAIKTRITEQYAPVAAQVHTSAIELFSRMIRPGANA